MLYGYISGFSAGCLYLVVAAFTQGYFLFSEQFAVLFLLLGFILTRKSQFVYAGICVGLAFGFKQYALLGLFPLLYLMQARGDRRFHFMILPAIATGLSSFGVLLLVYGSDTLMSALNWTFGVGPAYISGQDINGIPNYHADNLFSYSVSLISSIFIVLPVLLFAGASVIRRGLRSSSERAILMVVILLSGTLLIRQYLHYWILLLPFLVILACREFADKKESG